jgi:hypothetical protein
MERPFGGRDRSSLRKALEDNDLHAIMDEIRGQVNINKDGCWIWPRLNKAGYPITGAKLPGHARYREYLVHRIVLETVHGKSLGSQSAHHKCAVPACVNPDHLQPVTHAENTAEMLSRHSHLKFQEEALAIIRELAPNHEFLNRIELR